MSLFVYRLLPPRPDFPADMSEGERRIMQEHAAYWGALMNRGVAIVFGPVADPAGMYGIAIFRSEDAAGAKAVCSGDPALRASAGFNFEVWEMPGASVAEERT